MEKQAIIHADCTLPETDNTSEKQATPTSLEAHTTQRLAAEVQRRTCTRPTCSGRGTSVAAQ